MKRHEALQPLSRDHHETLILAQLLKKGAPKYRGLPEDREGKIIYARSLFNEKILAHFESEESIINKLIDLKSDTLNDLGEIVKTDHKELRQMFANLHQDSTEEDLDVLGKKLEAHVRMEERIYFPKVEELCPAVLMEEISSELKH
jgi:hypothetical protein